MTCDTLDAILDEHRDASVPPAERSGIDQHLAACARCAGAWSAHRLLASERIAAPPADLFERLTRRPTQSERAGVRPRRWLSPALAAGVLLAVGAVLWWGAPEQQIVEAPSAPPPPILSPATTARLGYQTVGDGPLLLSADGRVQVTEFFMWGCGPCFAFETELVRWEIAARERVELVRVPVMFNPLAELHARAFYTAAALGKLDVLQQLFYDEIHVRGNALDSPVAIAELFASIGVDGRAFADSFNSQDVDAAVERAAALGREYRVTATPSLIVGGLYATGPRFADSFERMLTVVDRLLDEACATPTAAEQVPSYCE